ncbi:MAG: T9SS type A sorting domain-containing protein [Bacteroidales bacterium]|nr:T9SS type A sorting domain-containing protein [Bacteroidales bacterium]
MYRVFVDIMGSRYLGQNTLLYLMDGLWGTSEEHLPPAKFRTSPFNNNWSNSILASLDPVAIESVCLDILQKEFVTEEINSNDNLTRYNFVQWNAVDDYLHQAASSSNWPLGIIYDPDNSGIPLASLGVHEHWNNPDDMLYSGNLGTGNGIELIRSFYSEKLSSLNFKNEISVKNIKIFPNPANDFTFLSLTLQSDAIVKVTIFSLSGNEIFAPGLFKLHSGNHNLNISLNGVVSGYYTLITEVIVDGKTEISRIKLVVK